MEQSTGAANTENSASVSFPNGDWPVGTGFQINLISTSRNNQAIYAQSGQFNITSSGMAGSASSSTGSSSTTTMMMTMSTPTTMTRSTTTSSGTGAASANAGDASGGIPNAVSRISQTHDTKTDNADPFHHPQLRCQCSSSRYSYPWSSRRFLPISQRV